MSIPRPEKLYDREGEWADLVSFATNPQGRQRLGVVYGRRRFGKSFLLRRLVEQVGGIYYLALDEAREPGLRRFATEIGQLYTPPARVAFESWEIALRETLNLLGARGSPQVLVLDEYPYLRAQSPELDSVVQALMDSIAGGEIGSDWKSPVSVILCGSALAVMTELLSGTSPLRGRASLDMPILAFDYRQSRAFWEIEDNETAFSVHSIVGGAAGYRDLASNTAIPQRRDALLDWISATICNPSHSLFREDEYLLREDPRVTKEAIYYSLLGAIAEGATTQSEIARAVGKKSDELNYSLNVLVSAGFVTRDADLLTQRNPVYRVADPIVRFHKLITRRHQAALEDRKTQEVWEVARDTYRSQIIGPHFESICRRWTEAYASTDTLGGPIGHVRAMQVNDPVQKQKYELDAVALTQASTGRRRRTIQVLGEAKGTTRPCTTADLSRLEHIQDLLQERGSVTVTKRAKKLIFSMNGFDRLLIEAARSRQDVELVDLDRLYFGV